MTDTDDTVSDTVGDTASDTAPVQGPSRTGAALPVPPDDVVTAARSVPDHWITVVDPGWSGEGTPPAWALVGAWRTDAAGAIVEWRDNDVHRPSPTALGWPAATDQLDLLAQRAVTGYVPADLLVGVLAASDVLVPVTADGDPVRATSADGAPVVAVFSSEAQADAAGAFGHRLLPMRTLLPLVPDDHQLLLNPAGSAVLALDVAPIAERLRD